VAGEHTVTTPDGRMLVVTESGDPSGRPVLMHHGTPSSGLLYGPHEALAREQGIRLLGYDRAGYGRSTRHAGRRVADCVGDVHAIADALGLDRFACWGISGGGPHVLACAALCDERCAAVASLAAVAPYEADELDWYEGMGQENWDEFGAALAGEETLRAFLAPIREHHLRIEPHEVVSIFETLVGPEDRSALTGEFAAWVTASGKRGLDDGMDGWVDDDLAFAEPWGFELASIDRPVLLLHGEDDRFVPVSHGHWLAERIPNVDARIDASDGHLTLLERRMHETHEWLLARL